MKVKTRFIKSFGVLLIAALLLTAVPVAAQTAPIVTLTTPDKVTRLQEDFVIESTTTNPSGGTVYTNVRFNITVSGPEAFPAGTSRADIFTITNVDPEGLQGVNDTFALEGGKFVGYWGPEAGFELPISYEAASTFTLSMGEGAPLGNYEITVDLVDLTPEPDVILATATDNINFVGLDLDNDWYKTGDEAVVAVYDLGVTDNKVLVNLSSELAGHSTSIWAYEDPENDGVFEGTFTLVNTLSGVNQLLVINGDNITAKYGSDDEAEAGVDDTAPVTVIVSPLKDAITNDATPEIKATYSDDNSGIDEDSVEMTLGGTVVGTATVTGVTYTPTSDLSEGLHTVTVDVSDLAGNAALTASWSFTVDTEAPVIANQQATPKVVKPDEEVTIVFTAEVSDVTSGVDTVKIDLSSIGGEADQDMLDDGEGFDAVADDGIYTAALTKTFTTADERGYTLAVTATDKASNDSITKDIDFVVSSDIVPPVITDAEIQYPYGLSSALPDDEVVISAKVTDDVAVASVKAVCEDCDAFTDVILYDDGSGKDETAGDGIYTGVATVASSAVKGSYPITITATDDKGNEATDESLTLVVDLATTGFEIELFEGWNLISLPLIPHTPAIETILSDLISNESVNQVVAWPYDHELGKIRENRWAPPLEGITEMVDGVGYWVEMLKEDVLSFTGIYQPLYPATPSSYQVYAGWNLIGYKSIENRPASTYLGEAGGENLRMMFGFDESNGLYYQIIPTDDNLVSGEGYWLAVSTNATIFPPEK